jgi:hypothetical protein
MSRATRHMHPGVRAGMSGAGAAVAPSRSRHMSHVTRHMHKALQRGPRLFTLLEEKARQKEGRFAKPSGT